MTPPVTPESIADRRAGSLARFLDGADPDWRTRIRDDTLRIEIEGDCILAQLYGSYKEGIDRYSFTPADLYGFGVELANEELGAPDDQGVTYAMLNAAWKKLLTPKPWVVVAQRIEATLVRLLANSAALCAAA